MAQEQSEDDILARLLRCDDPLCKEAAAVISRLQRSVSELQGLVFTETKKSTEGTTARKRIKAPSFKRNTPPIDRFLAYVDKDGPNGCWLWCGSGNENYGYFWTGSKRVTVQRFSFEFHKRKLRSGEQVRHMCDNSWCVNPEHLEAGTAKQNAADKSIRGRSAYAKVAPDQAKEIYERYNRGEAASRLAQEFGLTANAVALIGTGQTWKALGHTSPLAGLSAVERRERIARRQSPLTAKDVRRIRQRAQNGERHKDIAADYGISRSACGGIISRQRWGHVT